MVIQLKGCADNFKIFRDLLAIVPAFKKFIILKVYLE